MKQKQENTYIPYPYRRPGPGAKETRITQIDPDYKLRVFNFASKSANIYKFDWTDIQAIAISDSDNQGAIFIESSENGSIVVKGNDNAAVNTFFHNLGEVIGLPQQQRRIVRWDQPEFKVITDELQRASFSFKDLYQRIRQRLDRPYLEIVEYIPGLSFTEIGPKRALKVFNYFDPLSRNRMIKLGMVYGLDLLLNNCERLPLDVWNNAGDPQHLIVRVEPSYLDTTKEIRDIENLTFDYELIYAIDHRHTYIDEFDPYLKQQLLQRYYNKVENYLNNHFIEIKSVMRSQLDPLYDTMDQRLESIGPFRDFVSKHTLYDVKEMSLLQVMIGLTLTLDIFVQMGAEKLLEIYQSLFVEKDYKEQWNTNLKRLNMEYFTCMILIFQKFTGLYVDVVRWVKDATLNQFQYNPLIVEEILCRNPIYKQKLEQQKAQELKQQEDDLMNNNDPSAEGQVQSQKDQDPNDEVIEHNDMATIDKQVKDMFDLDLEQLRSQLKNNTSQIQQVQQNPVPIQQKQPPKEQPVVQTQPQQPQQQQPKPQGGMLAAKAQKK